MSSVLDETVLDKSVLGWDRPLTNCESPILLHDVLGQTLLSFCVTENMTHADVVKVGD